eukprot:TRINITY_DN739_c7_g1_i1.p1 TRINITY_DN739_c7_g1~~TRINITY_DN739_c7_g1_i1.p1  ORF type:complete len:133 (+),score=23.49 TRINITY_DN739_c7_g1_i1:71-469(+)
MGKVSGDCKNLWCVCVTRENCGNKICMKLHIDDEEAPKASVMVPVEVLDAFAAKTHKWLSTTEKKNLWAFGKALSKIDVNICLQDRKALDIKSLLDTIVSHLTFLPMNTLSPVLRKCLVLFCEWICKDTGKK